MTTARIEEARNFRKVDDRLVTCGQPSEEQLAAARSAGVEVVINLALHDDPRYSLPDERGTVEALGMTYRHIPVQFGQPTEADLLAFFDVMDTTREQYVLVHWREDVFVILSLTNASGERIVAHSVNTSLSFASGRSATGRSCPAVRQEGQRD